MTARFLFGRLRRDPRLRGAFRGAPSSLSEICVPASSSSSSRTIWSSPSCLPPSALPDQGRADDDVRARGNADADGLAHERRHLLRRQVGGVFRGAHVLEVADGVAAHEILGGVLAGDAVVALPRDELHRREQKSEHDAGAVRGRGGRAQGAGGVTTSRHVSGHGETTVEIRPAAPEIPSPIEHSSQTRPAKFFSWRAPARARFGSKGRAPAPRAGERLG